MEDVNRYLATLSKCKVRTLEEIINWNKEHAEIALPGGNVQLVTTSAVILILADFSSQSKLIAALNGQLPPEEHRTFTEHYKKVASSVDSVFEKYSIDIIVAPGDSSFPNFAAANGALDSRKCTFTICFTDFWTGYPNTAMPIGCLDYNGRPIGLMAVAGAHRESVLFNFLSAYESSLSPREVPSAFLEETAKSTSTPST